MSLKAKIEAVIYAAEEPVSLAQLAAVFADELPSAPEDVPAVIADADQGAEPSAESLLERGYLYASPDSTENELEQLVVLTAQRDKEAAEKKAAAELIPVETIQPDPAAAEADAKKLARQRDREVRDRLKSIVDELIQEYSTGDRGMEIREVAGGYRIATKPEYHDAVRSFVKSLKPAMKLSLQALETLAVIAYKQPVTAPEVSEIRGVESGGVLGTLVSRKLITTAGRKQVIGRPILYKTTREFLLRFGLKDLNELPSIEEFEKLAGDVEIEVNNSVPEEPALPFETDDASDTEPAATIIEPPQSAATELGTPLDPLDSSSPVPPHPPQSGETAAAAEPAKVGFADTQTEPASDPELHRD